MDYDDDINNNHAKLAGSDTDAQGLSEQPILTLSNRRTTRRIMGGTHESMSSASLNEPDPNVFLISSDTNSHNTIRKTKHDVKRFVMYIDEQFGEQISLHTIAADVLCNYLKHYFENTKKFDGTQYEPDTLRSFLLSIERYLKSKNYPYNLMESPFFQPCRQVIMNKREEWKRLGGMNQTKAPVFASINTQSLTVFDRTKPDGLLLEMYVHITKLCQLSVTQLLWGDILLVEEQYLIYQQDKIENPSFRLYATPHQLSTCPVQAYRLYATHRPPQCNTPQSPFFLTPRSTNAHHVWYKTTAVGKNLEQILQKAIQHANILKQTSSSSSSSSPNVIKPPSTSSPNGKRTEPPTNFFPLAKRISSSVQPLNLSVASNIEEDSGTSSSSPTNSFSHELIPVDTCKSTPIWDESVTDILLTVAKQRDTRTAKINTLRAYLEEKLGFVEFLCLYRGFKSEPKLTFHQTPWEHYQRFLPVLFTLLTLDNTTV
ncbi:unnamed protein product [Adineta ricciae]|uniref:ZMYM2-like/QRICH1 C-terminal domain-containing protein n=1 Tax=Adineta ricciae TaxID=249248 RepID=A0A814HKP7_ADIRI|nr:unnamed protein product [Adineta ricciae]CAF1010715.1 unnamed protein product [Adineta ricciae]